MVITMSCEERKPAVPHQEIPRLAPLGRLPLGLPVGLGQVADRADAPQDGREPGDGRVEADAGPVRGVVHPCEGHARQLAEEPLVQPDAGGAADPLHVEVDLAEAVLPLPHRGAEGLDVLGILGSGGQPGLLPAAPLVEGAEPLVPDEPVDPLAPGAAEDPPGLPVPLPDRLPLRELEQAVVTAKGHGRAAPAGRRGPRAAPPARPRPGGAARGPGRRARSPPPRPGAAPAGSRPRRPAPAPSRPPGFRWPPPRRRPSRRARRGAARAPARAGRRAWAPRARRGAGRPPSPGRRGALPPSSPRATGTRPRAPSPP